MKYIVFLVLFLVGCTADTTETTHSDTGALFGKRQPKREAPMFESEMHNGPRNASAGFKDGWAAYGRLEAPQVPGDPSPPKSVRLQVDFPEAGDYTVEFALQVPGNFSQNRVRLNATALITWAVEGNFISRRVTITNGISITGVAQGCTIEITDTSEGVAGIDPPGSVFEYLVAMQVAKGSRATGGSPPVFAPIDVTQATDAMTAGTVLINFDIPQEAGVNSFAIMGEYQTGATFVAFQDSDLVIQQLSQNQGVGNYMYGDVRGKFVPLAPGTTRISVVVNRTVAASTAFASLIFGVDG